MSNSNCIFSICNDANYKQYSKFSHKDCRPENDGTYICNTALSSFLGFTKRSLDLLEGINSKLLPPRTVLLPIFQPEAPNDIYLPSDRNWKKVMKYDTLSKFDQNLLNMIFAEKSAKEICSNIDEHHIDYKYLAEFMSTVIASIISKEACTGIKAFHKLNITYTYGTTMDKHCSFMKNLLKIAFVPCEVQIDEKIYLIAEENVIDNTDYYVYKNYLSKQVMDYSGINQTRIVTSIQIVNPPDLTYTCSSKRIGLRPMLFLGKMKITTGL